MIKTRKRLIVCDYDNPKKYTFPSFGFGSSEKRVWHFAKTASELKEFDVIITGPLWLPEYVPNAKYFPKRLNGDSYKEFLNKFGKCDYFFAGHEYFDKDEWVSVFEKCADTLISYQLHPYTYKKCSFDGIKKFLFCYSDQMLKQYKDQKPLKALLFHSGVDENPKFEEKPDNYILWIGRLDKDKAPHYAIDAARLLNIPLVVLGKTIYQKEYFEKNRRKFESNHVKLLGVKFGEEKMKIISKAACMIYTIDKEYTEAGAGVMGEVLASGVPIAGMTWTGNDAICEAVDNKYLGIVVGARQIPENDIPFHLAEAVKYCLTLDRKKVFNLGSRKYNPHILVKKIFEKIKRIQKFRSR